MGTVTDGTPGRLDAADYERSKNRENRTPSLAQIEQSLTGAKLAADAPIRCSTCGSHVGEGSPVTVAAVRSSDGGRWRIERVFGGACSPIVTGDVDAPRPLVLAEGDIGVVTDSRAQDHWPVLLDVIGIDTDIAGGAE